MVSVCLSVVVAAASAAEVYETFNKSCVEHFGAEKEDEVYRSFGRDVRIVNDGTWSHVSEASACLAWETNIPARTYVEYGTSAKYGHRTLEPERHFYLHVHYLRGLKPSVTYHYRLAMTDERGNVITSEDRSLATRAMPAAVRVPDDIGGPPFILDRPNTTYLVTEDLAATGTAIFIAASGITLDLGGHIITYDDERDTSNEGACGVRGHKRRGIGLRGVTVVNGTIVQGQGNSSTRRLWDTLYNPIFFKNPSELEIAGVTTRYHGSQVIAVALIMGARRASVHHNVFLDAGASLFNRHTGMDVIAFGARDSACHHNLIKRTRHRGVKAASNNEIYANEIYIDSFATNSYGIMYYGRQVRDLDLHHNRIFGTGYHPIGIGSGQGCRDVQVHGNFIQMQGTPPQGRWQGGQGGGDPTGQLHPVNCVRLQRPAGRVTHYDNVFVARGQGRGAMMRGVWLVPGSDTGGSLVLRNNRIKLIAEDDQAEGYAVSAGGAGEENRSSLVALRGNTIITNLCHVQFGDNYSHGGRYLFTANRFVRTGNDPRYEMIRFGWRGWKYGSYGHAFIDSEFEGGAGYDHVSFDGGRIGRYDFAVGWSIDIAAAPGARVLIRDRSGGQVFAGPVPQEGCVSVPLVQYTQNRAGKTSVTPHTVTVQKNGKTVSQKVTIDQRRPLEMSLPD